MSKMVPAILLINRQASSQAQLLLDQATLTTQAFLAGETSDLQNLALLVSQRPTLTRLLAEQDFSSLDGYLETLRVSVNLDLILICDGTREVKGIGKDISMSELCLAEATSGHVMPVSNDDLYLYTSANVESVKQPVYRVIVGKRISLILTEFQQNRSPVLPAPSKSGDAFQRQSRGDHTHPGGGIDTPNLRSVT